MINPDGKECRFYYQDFHRGRDEQECRLAKANPKSAEWAVKICTGCPVPDILASNSDPNLVLEGTISKGFVGFGRKMEVKAFCSKHLIDLPNPQTGCPQCAKEKPGLAELFSDI